MEIKNFYLTVDTVNKIYNEYFETVAGDYGSNLITIKITSNTAPYDLTGLTVEMAFLKSNETISIINSTNGLTILDAAQGKISCLLSNSTISTAGKVTAEIRISSGSFVITTCTFDFIVRQSIFNKAMAGAEQEAPLIMELIQQLTRSNATMIADENIRIASEITRESNEDIRISDENTRISNENTRIENEDTRIENEDLRVSAEDARAFIEPYNSTSIYVKGNKVTYDGRTYYNIADCTGVSPLETTNWLLFADRGPISDVHMSDAPPENLNAVWVDTADEDTELLLEGGLMQSLVDQVNSFRAIVDKLNYVVDNELDPGYFKDVLPGSDPDVVPIIPEGAPDLGDGAAGTVGHILVRRGLKEDIELLQEGEFGFCIDTEELYIGNKGSIRLLAKVGGLNVSDSDNLTGEYLELIASNGEKFRLTVTNTGEMIVYRTAAEEAPAALPADSGRFNGLLINKVYGGGIPDSNATPCSHSFIELYNSTDNTMNLKGLAIQYGEYLKEWQMLPLRGEIKPYHSFLIRCAQHTDPYRRNTRFKILDYDMEWNIPLSSAGMKIYLNVPTDITTPSAYVNPANTDGSWSKEVGFIDLFAFGGEDVSRPIDGYLKGYLQIGNKDRMIKRRYSTSLNYAFENTGNNANDLEFIDLRSANVDIYAPRPTSYGQWTFYYNQRGLDPLAPNNLNIGFGYNGDTDRTFTWHSAVTDRGYLQYKLKESNSWTTVQSTRKFVALDDSDATIHSVIVKNLPFGTYEYRVGEEGRVSDIYEFEVVDASDTLRPINIVQVSDQQGWDYEEYTAWAKANDYIQSHETYDFILNTGDISQNANRPFEWRYYFDMARDNIRSHVHMNCVGNNDLVEKKDSIAFTYYSTVENSPYPSVYSFNYGYVHFISLDSNIIAGYRGIAEQVAFIREDMTKPENQKRWTIVYMHESPYTIVSSAKLRGFINVFAEVGIDLVLCGHHHCYSRSHPMGALNGTTDVIDPVNGVVYVMSQATGYKISGKQTPTPDAIWPAFIDRQGDPCYIKWEITYDTINMYPYRLTNILPLIDNVGKDVVAIPFDTGFSITK